MTPLRLKEVFLHQGRADQQSRSGVVRVVSFWNGKNRSLEVFLRVFAKFVRVFLANSL